MPPSAQEGSNAAGEANSADKEPQQKPAAALEEDDEFEDFPVEGLFYAPAISPDTNHTV
jgi:hypothetical protein